MTILLNVTYQKNQNVTKFVTFSRIIKFSLDSFVTFAPFSHLAELSHLAVQHPLPTLTLWTDELCRGRRHVDAQRLGRRSGDE